MKAVCLVDPKDPASFRLSEVPAPVPGTGELLVRIRAAGITPSELLWYPTSHTADGGARRNVIPGHEFSGVIDGLGEAVRGVEPGDAVYGMSDWFADGAMAEFACTRPAFVAPKPSNLSHEEAASLPIGTLTAWQGLFDRADLQAGERVLIHGGAGAVGVFAVQLAHYRGATVIATGSAEHAGFLNELGAGEVIDYHHDRFEDRVRDVDVVFDTVGGETLERSWPVLKAGGRMVTIAAADEAQQEERIRQAFFIVEPNREQLIEITQLVEHGHLRAVVDTRVPLAEVPAIYAGVTPARNRRGRLIADVSEPSR